jgi:hypothetical protein
MAERIMVRLALLLLLLTILAIFVLPHLPFYE